MVACLILMVTLIIYRKKVVGLENDVDNDRREIERLEYANSELYKVFDQVEFDETLFNNYLGEFSEALNAIWLKGYVKTDSNVPTNRVVRAALAQMTFSELSLLTNSIQSAHFQFTRSLSIDSFKIKSIALTQAIQWVTADAIHNIPSDLSEKTRPQLEMCIEEYLVCLGVMENTLFKRVHENQFKFSSVRNIVAFKDKVVNGFSPVVKLDQGS